MAKNCFSYKLKRKKNLKLVVKGKQEQIRVKKEIIWWLWADNFRFSPLKCFLKLIDWFLWETFQNRHVWGSKFEFVWVSFWKDWSNIFLCNFVLEPKITSFTWIYLGTATNNIGKYLMFTEFLEIVWKTVQEACIEI